MKLSKQKSKTINKTKFLKNKLKTPKTKQSFWKIEIKIQKHKTKFSRAIIKKYKAKNRNNEERWNKTHWKTGKPWIWIKKPVIQIKKFEIQGFLYSQFEILAILS